MAARVAGSAEARRVTFSSMGIVMIVSKKGQIEALQHHAALLRTISAKTYPRMRLLS